MRRPGPVVLAALTVMSVFATVTGCAGVPTSSAPQVVRSIGFDQTPRSTVAAPAPGADPRSVVVGFLTANTTDPERHNAARQYLTNDTAQRWQDTTATVVAGPITVDLANPVTNTVTVRFQRVGQLSASGIYTPLLLTASPGHDDTATFGLTQEKGQWRINQLAPGLLLTEADFEAVYNARPLYFLNATGSRLVPDLRWSALQGQSLATFLLGQLVAGPRPELATAVTSEVPTQAAQQRISVSVGSPTQVQLPGSGGLDLASKLRLAAQLAYTLQVSGFVGKIQLLDGADPVSVPGLPSPFELTDLARFASVRPDNPMLTFVRGGAVFDSTGKPLPGVLGTPKYGLTTAVFDRAGSQQRVAGTAGSAGTATMMIGSDQGLTDSGVPPGPLTQPAWAPGAGEVWVGSGMNLYRAAPGKAAALVVQTSGRGGAVTGTIAALAFSPEGTRLALVVRDNDGASQVWVGSVVRSGPDARLDELAPISPPSLQLLDVGWRDATTLLAVGQDTTRPGSPAGLWRLRVDGSELAPTDDIAGLPDAPRSLAVSPNALVVWVAVGTGAASTIWQRAANAASWSPPVGGSFEPGSAPAFSQ